MGIIEAISGFFKIIFGAEKIIEKNQDAKEGSRREGQGEQNANAKQAKETLDAVTNAARAQYDPAIDDFVRGRWEKP